MSYISFEGIADDLSKEIRQRLAKVSHVLAVTCLSRFPDFPSFAEYDMAEKLLACNPWLFSPVALASLAPRDSSLLAGAPKMLPVSRPFGVRPPQAPGSYG